MGRYGHSRAILAAAAILSAVTSAKALEPATTGVVVIHGKWGNSGQMSPVADALRDEGFLVETPEMPWSGQRLFDRGYPASMEEIDAAVDRLRAKGAVRMVIAGQSLGGNAALAYSAQGRPLAAVVAFAPAHFPEGRVIQEKVAASVAKAMEMIAAGEGDENAGFTSVNDGNRTRAIRATATNYLSYYGPAGPAAMTLFVERVGPAPILWVAGTLDPTTTFFETRIRPLVPAATRVERHDVVSSHGDIPTTGRSKAVEWLKHLP